MLKVSSKFILKETDLKFHSNITDEVNKKLFQYLMVFHDIIKS
jgi:hypothetical protein